MSVVCYMRNMHMGARAEMYLFSNKCADDQNMSPAPEHALLWYLWDTGIFTLL